MRGAKQAACGLVLVTTLVATACGSDDGTDSGGNAGGAGGGSEGECTDERTGGAVTMGMFSATNGFDPVRVAGGGVSGETELAAVYDTLMRYDQESGEFEPQVAESLEPNADFSEWTLTLRDGVTFGNGDPLTTEAVKTSIERHQDPQNASTAAYRANTVSAMRIVDDRTMVFELDGPWATFPYLLAERPGMVVNPAVLAERGAEALNADPAGAGVGPYEVARYEPGEEIVLEPRDDYWDGPPCIEQLRFVTIPGGQATYEAFAQAELDVAFLREPLVIDEARSDGVNEFTDLVDLGQMVLINNGVRGSTPPTADERVRRAVALALDPEQIDERVNEGTGLPTTALMHPDSRYATEVEGPEHDPEQAQELVDEAQADGEWDGSLRLLCDNSPARVESAIAMEAQLEAAGFEVDADTDLDTQDLISQVIVDADYDLACWGDNINQSSPWATLGRYRSDAPNNFPGYASPEMDTALDALRAAPADEQGDALAEVQEIWNETMPSAALAASEQVIVWGDRVHGLDFNQTAVVLFGNAYVDG
jgi:peptide/nickel transport system substrate-binding protein